MSSYFVAYSETSSPRYNHIGWLGTRRQVTYAETSTPWYNCTGWLGVNHEVSYLLALRPQLQLNCPPFSLKTGWKTQIFWGGTPTTVWLHASSRYPHRPSSVLQATVSQEFWELDSDEGNASCTPACHLVKWSDADKCYNPVFYHQLPRIWTLGNSRSSPAPLITAPTVDAASSRHWLRLMMVLFLS